jgi:hypothetical protein
MTGLLTVVVRVSGLLDLLDTLIESFQLWCSCMTTIE